MQYSQLKDVINIDNQITNLHKELSGLYTKRALFMGTSHLSELADKDSSIFYDPWVVQIYSYLASAWMVHGIAIPPLAQLEKKLLKARKMIEQFMAFDLKLGSEMGILLVPPTNVLSFPVAEKIRVKQQHVRLNDYLNPDLSPAFKNLHKKSWQLLVAYTGPNGLEYGSAAQIMKYKKYLIDGQDMRALGVREYTALSLQINEAIDKNVWNALLNPSLTLGTQVPSVTFLNGQYRFELDEPNSILGDERFRPAIEVRGY